MKKLTPIFYLFFVFPIAIVDTFLIAYGTELGTLWRPNAMYLLLLVIFGGIFLLIGNFAVITLEDHRDFKWKYHFRQSSYVYTLLAALIVIYSNLDVLETSTQYIYVVGLMHMSVLAILVNAFAGMIIRPKRNI
ncbi:MAG: hypothetical protein G01um101477_49 [Candidatus Doudnabacteria bacterium Gr01-1014_77]|uniref:Uncharacterized protein n=1 Tax=Candidatus Doudnabacteria bacterium Gr01-1014_77 TaxID=2017133 RepID=A0A554JDW4_9BACT|nr:MAG: hypothetical protein G01um101477_49 [Candidatus Doudnabacteria bacterium Gr01-1014_77]